MFPRSSKTYEIVFLQVAPDNVFHESIGFHYTLARLPWAAARRVSARSGFAVR